MIPNTRHSLLLAAAAGLALLAVPAVAIDTDRADVQAFIESVVSRHELERDTVTAILAAAETQQSILDAISRPAERVRPWHEYRQIFLKPERIKAGVAFWNEHATTLQAAEEKYGVPAHIIVAIIGVETYYGRITGNYEVRDALATLAFDYPPRAKFFSRELEEYLLLLSEESLSPSTVKGSYAGAMGRGQFIPSSYRAYAVDFDGDGQRDLFSSWPDAIGSVANYFARHRWKSGEPVITRAQIVKPFSIVPPQKNTLKLNSTVGALGAAGVRLNGNYEDARKATLIRLDAPQRNEYWVGFHNFYVITRYNRSVMYALAVYQLGTAIAQQREAN